MKTLVWYLEQPTPVRRWAAALLSEAIGLRADVRDEPPPDGEPHVHHGVAATPRPRVLNIPAQPSEEPPLEVLFERAGNAGRLDADVLDATVKLVTDGVHAGIGSDALDGHGRVRADASWQGSRGALLAPLVNRYAARIAEALPTLGRFETEPRWPDGRRAAIGISHDVDRPDKYAILRAVRQGRVPPPRRLPWYAARAARDAVHRLRDRSPDDFWLFDEVVQAEAERGMRSTFLFSVVPAYAGYGSTNDVLYDAAWPHLRRAMADLRADGLEIGLHASYHAYRDAARFAAERATLEELSGGEVRGLRHHFWQVGPYVEDTLRAHEAAGFRYDSSIAYNDAVGLRRSIALPYRPWDPEEGRPLATWQLPVLALDSAASASAPTVEQGVERVWAGIEAIVEAGGVGVLDWHVRCSFPANRRYRAWAEIYLGVLDRLAKRPEIWTTGLGEIADWADARASAIQASDGD